MKLIKKYLPGDKVFAKVRGYPPWPARVESVQDANTKHAKYKVFFYGTGETAVCKVEELFLYEENKEKYGKHLKRKIFHEGLQQLEQELNNDIKTQAEGPKKEAVVEPTETESPPAPEPPAVPAAPVEPPPPQPPVSLDSDLETGPLVIDEGDKKKQIKRKSLATPISTDSPEPKKKRGRGKSWHPSETITTPKPEINESQADDTQKEVVSRSGRKIKPKRFADFSSSDEIDMENFGGRSRGRSRAEEVPEAPPVVPKKRISVETNEKKEEKKSPAKDETQQKPKLRWLRMENQLLKLDAQIKSNLGLDQANTDKCLEAMDEMLSLQIEPLMLKKHVHIVETVKRLRRYIGNVTEWKLNEDQVAEFKQKAEAIRQKAETIYNKFKDLFTVPEDQSFWQYFSDQVEIFKETTKNLSEEKLFALIADPTIDAQNNTEAEKIKNSMDVDEETDK